MSVARVAPWAGTRAAPRHLAAALTVVGFLAAYLPVLVHAITGWIDYSSLSFGFFGPPVAALVIYLRRSDLAESQGAGTGRGLPLLLLGLAILLAGQLTGVNAVMGASLLPTVTGAAAYLWGFRSARVLLPATALLSAVLSVYIGFLNTLGFALQLLTAEGAAWTATAFGVVVRRSGVDLFTGGAHFVVAQPCSGMDSLLALAFLGAALACVVRASAGSTIVLVTAAVPVALASNVARVSLVVLGAAHGVNLENGAAHAALSALAFLVAVGVFIPLVGWLGCLPRLRAA